MKPGHLVGDPGLVGAVPLGALASSGIELLDQVWASYESTQ